MKSERMKRGMKERSKRHLATKALVAGALALAGGCMTGPHNGTSTSGPVVGKSLTFQGYSNEPNYAVRIQVLTDSTFNPSNNANWVTIANTSTDATPDLYVDTPDPLYAWSVSAVPVPNAGVAARWPQGGLVRLRAIHPDAGGAVERVLTTFDQINFNECALAQPSWGAVGTVCEGLGVNNSVVVSTTNTPVLPGNPAAFNFNGFLGRKGKITETETGEYYDETEAPATLSEFRTRYGFPGNEITATYYNDGDLGFGREMHCKTFITPAAQVGVACYVTNYSGVDGAVAFNVDPNVVLADAVARQHEFATVAMTYEPGVASNPVKFVVFGADGDRVDSAQLDSTGNNNSIPNNCLSCHGINSSYNSDTDTVSSNARFLPFDPFSFKFSAAPGFTFADQADDIRRLNQLVKITNTSPAINEFIDGMYAPEGVANPAATAKNTFVPADWADATDDLDGTTLYRGVVKPACRTCHMSADAGTLDFADYSDFTTLSGTIRNAACGTSHVMPHAERVMKHFWQSGARAYLITGLPAAAYPDPLNACKP